MCCKKQYQTSFTFISVIDFCLTRNLVTDPETNFTSLRLAWASRNNCEQRAGRTGRMMNGFCYRLVTKDFYLNQMQSTTEPEIVNNPLEDVILKAKILNIGPPESLLALAMEKPKLSDVGKTVLRLKEAGALFRTTSGIVKMFDGDITFIGRVMSSLPLDIKLSKLIVFGYCFSVLDECIVIGNNRMNRKNEIETIKTVLFFSRCFELYETIVQVELKRPDRFV